MKLFGTKRGGSRLAGNRTASNTASKTRVAAAPGTKGFPFKGVSIVLAVVLVFEILYFVAVYSDNAFISKWRNIYINTALDTLNHKWLATAIIPPDIIDEVIQQRQQSLLEQEGMESNWGETSDDPQNPPDDATDPQPVTPPDSGTSENPPAEDPPVDAPLTPDEEKDMFFELFHEVDRESMEAYVEAHPEVLENGWSNIYINEAGLDDKGTDIQTIYGEQILAIDAPNQVLLIRVEGSSYMGVLAVAKDPSRLSLQASSQLGVTGETAGHIASQHNGLVSITASGFIDPNGVGNGGILAGYAMCDGVEYGDTHMGWGYKRLELREDNLMYIKDASSPVGEGTTDAVEFQPALIIDGKVVVDGTTIYSALSPRTCIGQTDKYEILMLVIEGRMPTRSLGTDVIECANILKRHDCMQAMNLDGGTSAMMWFDGEYVTKCSNAQLPQGRPLPNAFVYAKSE